MKEPDNNPLDQYFRRALADREEPPREKVWQGIESQIESPRKKGLAWWWLAAAALVVLSLVLPYLQEAEPAPALPLVDQPSPPLQSEPQTESLAVQARPKAAGKAEVLAPSLSENKAASSRPLLPLDGLVEVEEESEWSPVVRQDAPRYYVEVKLRKSAPAKSPAAKSTLRRDSLLPALNESLWAYTEAQWDRLKEGESPQLPRLKKPQELRIPLF